MRRHPLDPLSLVFGLLFTAVALTFLGGGRSVADIGAARLWPIPIIVAGLIVFLYAAKRMLRSEPERADEPTNPEPHEVEGGSIDRSVRGED